jgi:hypothetical protein
MKKEHKMTNVAPMYVYATEMVAAYYQRLKLSGKRVLTVTGSGDQVANALFYGASEVVGFDINRNSLFMTELKLVAIQTLTYQDFLRFFSQTKKGFDQKLYDKVRPSLSRACQKYFDELYADIGQYGLGVSDYFRNRGDMITKKKACEINGYLADADAYRKMKTILLTAHPILLVENVLNLAIGELLKGKKFDVINLSNIPNYLTGRSFGLTEENVLSYFRKLKKLVAKQGSIFFYSYDNAQYPNKVSANVPPISRPSFFKKIKETNAFIVSRKSFPGLIDGNTDRITILSC